MEKSRIDFVVNTAIKKKFELLAKSQGRTMTSLFVQFVNETYKQAVLDGDLEEYLKTLEDD